MSTLIVRVSAMKQTLFSLKGLVWLFLLSLPAVLLYVFFYSEQLIFYVIQTQQKMHRELAVLLQQVKQNPDEYGPALIAVSFLYGIFHAAGPGHGKAIIATYMGTQVASLKKGIQFSFMAAFLQAAVAVLLVTALVRLLDLSMRQSQWIGSQFEAVSYLLVVLMGALICVRQLRQFRQMKKSSPGDYGSSTAESLSSEQKVAADNKKALNMLSKPVSIKPVSSTVSVQKTDSADKSLQVKQIKFSGAGSGKPGAGVLTSSHQLQADGSCSCGHKHMPLPDEVKNSNWKESAGIILSMGLRPCTGALLVLMLANALGLYWYGVASSLLMALGTAITVSSIAFLSVSVRRYAGQLMQLYQKGGSRPHWIAMLGIAGGLALMILGGGLFWSFVQFSQQVRPF